MEADTLNLRHLKAVAAIAATGSISAAARLVHLTQPAVTQGLAKLERQLGTLLFERRPGGMEPTEAIKLLAPRAEAALALIGNTRVTAPQMRAFSAVARRGSYAAAAAETGIRQPSLHRAISDLSLGLGVKLVERRGRGIALTRRGQSVARQFRLAEAELRAAVAELATLQGREIESIAIGAMPLSRARLIPNAVAEFNRKHPQVNIVIAEGSHADLVGPLREGDLDMIVGALRSPEQVDEVVQQPLFTDRPVVLARSRHPLCEVSGQLTGEQLASFAWAVPPKGTPLREQWRRMFDHSGFEPPRVAIECGSVIIIRQLLMQTDFLTLLSPDQVAVELEAGWLKKIGPAPGDPHRLIGVTTRLGWRTTPLQREFIQVLVSEGERIAAERD